MACRLLRLPAYVSLSRFTMRAGSEAIHWRMKFEPMKPAPPVTRMRSSMLDTPHRVRTRHSDSNHNHSRTRSLSGFGGGYLMRRVRSRSDDRRSIQTLRDGRSAGLDLLTRRMLTRIPPQYVVIGFFDRPRDFGPEILALNPLAFPGCGLTAKFGIVDEQVEHALKICLVATVEGKAGAIDHFIIFRNIAGQHADTGRHGIEKSQRQALKLRRKHEQSGIGEKLFEMASRDPGKKTDLVGFVTAQALDVGIGVTRSSGEYQFHVGVEGFEGIDQEMAVLFRRKPAQEKDVVVGDEIPLNQFPGEAPGRHDGAIRDVDSIALVLLAVMLLQGTRDHHGGIGRGNRSRFSPAQYARRDPAPLAALPVETLHGDYRLLAGQPRKKRKQRRSEAVVMNDIVVRRHGMRWAHTEGG